MAMRMGAHHFVDKSAEAAVDEVLRLTGGSGVDLVIDTAGARALYARQSTCCVPEAVYRRSRSVRIP
jgi:NADPH:quinone reductase-like Zn-dependent oxidoreductase